MRLQGSVTGGSGQFHRVVFRYDWADTRTMSGDEAKGATFIEPELSDEFDDWGARGALLEKYRRLASVMQARGIEPVFPFPLYRLAGFKKRLG